MNSVTSLFSSDMNLNSNIPVQTGGASGMTIILVLIVSCVVFCSALLGINQWKVNFFWENGPNMGLMSALQIVMCMMILYLAFEGSKSENSAFNYKNLNNADTSGFNFRNNLFGYRNNQQI